MPRLSSDEYKKRQQEIADKKAFEKKIEEDRLGISRGKRKRIMSFRTYRIVKLSLLILIVLALFVFSPAVLPLTVLLALTMIPLKDIEKAKNRNVNKKYQIRLPKTDCVIAVAMIILALGVTGYSLVNSYIQQGEFNHGSEAEIRQELADEGVPSRMIEMIIKRLESDDGSVYTRGVMNGMSLLTGERNIFTGRTMVRRGPPPNMDFGGSDMPKRPSPLEMLKNMPLDMIFQMVFRMVCMAAVLIMVLLGLINLAAGLKYGEIKELRLSARFDDPEGRNALCPCGSGRKTKNCCGYKKR